MKGFRNYLIVLFFSLVAAGVTIGAVSTESDVIGIASSSSNSNPAGTDWLLGWTDWIGNQNLSASQRRYIGPFTFDVTGFSGTGQSTQQTNSAFAATENGVLEIVVGSASSNNLALAGDGLSIFTGSMTYRIGCRVRYEDVPTVSEDYYHYIGFNSGNNNLLAASNFAVIGVSRADNATNFVVQQHGGSGETVTDTGVAFTSDTWYNLEIEVTPTAVNAWIDGAKVADGITSNAPIGVSMGPTLYSIQRQGSPSATRSIYYDWCYYGYKPATARGSIATGGPLN